MDYLHKTVELAPYLADADHVDVKTRISSGGLLKYVARMLSYSPAWVVWLFKARKYLARIMGLRHPDGSGVPKYQADEVPTKAGEMAGFFTVEHYCPDCLWLAYASDKHLTGYIGVLVEPLPEQRERLHMLTIVRYKNWMGPVYFNLIRPFHHLIIAAMASYAAKEKDV